MTMAAPNMRFGDHLVNKVTVGADDHFLPLPQNAAVYFTIQNHIGAGIGQ